MHIHTYVYNREWNSAYIYFIKSLARFRETLFLLIGQWKSSKDTVQETVSYVYKELDYNRITMFTLEEISFWKFSCVVFNSEPEYFHAILEILILSVWISKMAQLQILTIFPLLVTTLPTITFVFLWLRSLKLVSLGG